ncbi:hypothetical protein L218DRAFT_962304 [Marasmius fiardii PR-910]|nr:hypothetical protein L218DRAFT_962304 [Marasmius fiardii PR-910]
MRRWQEIVQNGFSHTVDLSTSGIFERKSSTCQKPNIPLALTSPQQSMPPNRSSQSTVLLENRCHARSLESDERT